MFNSGPRNLLFEKPLSASLAAAPLLDHWEIPANEVIMEKLLGEGAFGEVYKGIIKCPIVNPKVRPSAKSSICTPVAIKLLKCECQPVWSHVIIYPQNISVVLRQQTFLPCIIVPCNTLI